MLIGHSRLRTTLSVSHLHPSAVERKYPAAWLMPDPALVSGTKINKISSWVNESLFFAATSAQFCNRKCKHKMQIRRLVEWAARRLIIASQRCHTSQSHLNTSKWVCFACKSSLPSVPGQSRCTWSPGWSSSTLGGPDTGCRQPGKSEKQKKRRFHLPVTGITSFFHMQYNLKNSCYCVKYSATKLVGGWRKWYQTWQ